MQQTDENRVHVDELLWLMWEKIGHFSNELDEYASRIFERPIRGSWRIFVHIARHGKPHYGSVDSWYIDNQDRDPNYPASEHIESLDVFASSYFHECAHGWYDLLIDYEKGEKSVQSGGEFVVTANDRDVEKLCDEISKFVCGLLNLQFHECSRNEKEFLRQK